LMCSSSRGTVKGFVDDVCTGLFATAAAANDDDDEFTTVIKSIALIPSSPVRRMAIIGEHTPV